MVADDPQHRIAVFLIAGEGPNFSRHFSRGRVGNASQDSGDSAADGTPFFTVVGQARSHEKAADICKAQAEGSVFIRQLRDLGGGELGHHHRDFQRNRPQPHRMLECRYIKIAVVLAKGQKVDRCQITSRVIKEHIFRAGIGGPDRPCGRAGMPIVDRGVILQPRIGTGPSGGAYLLPQISGLYGARDFAIGAIS